MNEQRRIKCKWCEYTTLAWYTTKNGKRHSGMERLGRHIEDEHEEHAWQEMFYDLYEDDA